MTDAEKKQIEDMSYESMLREWRHAPIGSKNFCGERGEFFTKVMHRKRDEESDADRVAASKRVGWDR